jgi:hypothetical protein
MQSLYEQYKPAWDRIARTRPSLTRMAMHVASKAEMEHALEYGSSVVVKWLSGDNNPSREAEFRAEKWLAELASPAPKPAADDTLLLVVCPTPEIAAKARRLLAVIGCEVEAV